MDVPAPWEFALLALAAYRLWRLIAKDTITEPVRAAVSYPDDQAVTLSDSPFETPRLEVVGGNPFDGMTKSFRVYVSTLIRCPWCMGFYCSVAVWAAWLVVPRVALFVAVPLAVSALVGLAAKLDP